MSPVPDEGYRVLNVAEVLADLPSLSREQLELVKFLEESGDRRSVILDRIADLMVVREGAEHVRATATMSPPERGPDPSPRAATNGGRPAAFPRPGAPATSASEPVDPAKELSPDLLSQMGGLLAKDAARKSVGTSAPSVVPARPQEPQAFNPSDTIVAHKAPKASKASKAPKAPKAPRSGRDPSPSAPSGHIVPGDGRRSRSGRTGRRLLKVVLVLLMVTGLGAGGYSYWKQTHKAATPSSPASVIVHRIPGSGYVPRTATQADGGPLGIAQAARDDGAKDADAALTQDGFVAGWRQSWGNTNGPQTVSVTVYQFRTVAGASAYSRRAAAAVAAGSKFPVPEITGAVGSVGGSSGDQTADVTFSQGAYLLKVLAAHGSAPGAVHEATLVAVNQYTALLPQ